MAAGRAEFRFYAELNDFLPPARRQRPQTRRFDVPATVKDMIEALGVPHTEVDLILLNGSSVDFSHMVADGDRVSVYPVFEAFDITPVLRVRPEPLRHSRFVLDVHLGRLARHLRLLGFDALYRNDADDADLAAVAAGEGRILLTRDVGLLKRRSVTHGYYVRSTVPSDQAAEVVGRFDLAGQARPFTRCLACNGPLADVPKAAVADRLPPATRRQHHEFRACAGCGGVYWRGSHHRRLAALADGLLAAARRRPRAG